MGFVPAAQYFLANISFLVLGFHRKPKQKDPDKGIKGGVMPPKKPSGAAIPRTPAYRSRDEEAKALMMKQVSFTDGSSASTVNLAFPEFFIGVKTFSKGSGSQTGDPDKLVHTPAPLVENPFASVEARDSYGYASGDAPFVVAVTREFMEKSLSHSRDGEIPERSSVF